MSSEILVREIRREDLQDLIELIRASKYDFTYGFHYNVHRYDPDEIWVQLAGTRKFPTLVAEYRGKVISFMKYREHWSEESNLYVDLIVTHPKYRGLGAGRKLLTECIKIAVEKGYDLVSLHTWASNRAMRLYSRLGFVWVPHTHVYMINLAPQLLKNNTIRNFFDDPRSLVYLLVFPPQKMMINGHVAWKYFWSSDKGTLAAIFDMNSRRLLAIKFGEINIELIPPERRPYLEESEVFFKVKTGSNVPVCLESKSFLLKPGEHELKAKAKEKIELIMSGFKFGFSLKIDKKLRIHTEMKTRYGDISEYEVALINNSDSTIEDYLTIYSDEVEVLGKAYKLISVGPHSIEHLTVRFRGAGKVKIRFRDEESELSIVDTIETSVSKRKIESYFWSVSEGSIHAKLLDIYVYPEIHIDGFELPINDKEVPWTYSDDDLELSVRFDIRGNILKAVVTILAKKNFDNELSLDMWSYFPSLRDAWIAIPILDDKVVVERAVHNIFPKGWAIAKQKIEKPWYAMVYGNSVLRFAAADDSKFTLLGPWGFRLSIPLKLMAGERKDYIVVFETISKEELMRRIKPCRALEISQEEYGDLVLRNNWIHKLKVNIDGDIKYSGLIERNSEEKIPLAKHGFGVLSLTVNMDGFYEHRKIPYIKPLGPAERTSDKELIIETTEVGGAIKKLTIKGVDILYWSEEPIRAPLHVPIMYGGTTLELVVDGEDLGLPLTKWVKTRPSEYHYKDHELEIARRYLILDDRSLLEEVKITNNANRYRDIKLREFIMLRGRARKLGNDKIFVDGVDPHIVDGRNYVWLETDLAVIATAMIYPRELEATLTAGNPIGFNPYIRSQAIFKLKPKKTIKVKTLISTNKDKLKEFADCLTISIS